VEAKIIRRGQHQVRAVLIAAAVGATTRSAVVWLIATATAPGIATPTWASAWLSSR